MPHSLFLIQIQQEIGLSGMTNETAWHIPEPLTTCDVPLDNRTATTVRRRGNPSGPRLVLTSNLDRLIPDPTAHPFPAGTLSRYLIKITRLGGYLARAAEDPPPGNIVMWRGMGRLSDIALGATLQINDVGNLKIIGTFTCSPPTARPPSRRCSAGDQQPFAKHRLT